MCVKYEEVLDSDLEVWVLVNVYFVSVIMCCSENYIDGCNKISNILEDRYGGLKKLMESCGLWLVL